MIQKTDICALLQDHEILHLEGLLDTFFLQSNKSFARFDLYGSKNDQFSKFTMVDEINYNLSRLLHFINFQNFGYFNKLKSMVNISFTIFTARRKFF
jgi:hypothetical protein